MLFLLDIPQLAKEAWRVPENHQECLWLLAFGVWGIQDSQERELFRAPTGVYFCHLQIF